MNIRRFFGAIAVLIGLGVALYPGIFPIILGYDQSLSGFLTTYLWGGFLFFIPAIFLVPLGVSLWSGKSFSGQKVISYLLIVAGVSGLLVSLTGPAFFITVLTGKEVNGGGELAFIPGFFIFWPSIFASLAGLVARSSWKYRWVSIIAFVVIFALLWFISSLLFK
jgi:hypothetical protein